MNKKNKATPLGVWAYGMFPKKGSLFPFVKSKMKENHHISFLIHNLCLFFRLLLGFHSYIREIAAFDQKLICLYRQHASPSKAHNTRQSCFHQPLLICCNTKTSTYQTILQHRLRKRKKEKAIFWWASQISLMSAWEAQVCNHWCWEGLNTTVLDGDVLKNQYKQRRSCLVMRE